MTNHSFNRKPDAAAILGRQLSTPRSRAQNGQFTREPPQPQWYDRAIEAHRLAEEGAAQVEVQRQADEQAHTAPVNIVDLIRATLAGIARPVTEQVPVTSTAPPALNDLEALLRGALSGARTVNGEPR